MQACLEENYGLLSDLMDRYQLQHDIFDHRKNNLIGIMAKKGNHKIVRLLAERGINPNN